MSRDDLIIKKNRETLSSYKSEVIRLRSQLKGLDNQYKRVIDELRKQVKWLQSNAFKNFFLQIIEKLKKIVG